MPYREISVDEAYRLVNTGPVVLVSTVSKDKQANIAPIAWSCPVRKEPTRVMLGVGKSHKTFVNIEETGVFVAGIPNVSQVELVKAAGSVSGSDIEKLAELKPETIPARHSDCEIPTGMIGYIECKVAEIFDTGSVALVVGDAVGAAADPDAYDGKRLLSEKPAGKTLHHLGNKLFVTPGDQVIG